MRRAYHPQTAKKYIISVITLAMVASALLVGSVGSMIQVASARNDSRRYSGYSNQQRNDNSSHNSPSRDTNSPQQTNQKPGTNDSPMKSTTQKSQAPAVESRQGTSSQVAPATTTKPAEPKPVTQKAAPTISPPDTAPAINQMNEAQAATEVTPVTYSSARISDETRNRIFIFAGVAAVTGALLYTMSYVTMGALTGRRPVPVRYVVPVNGAARS